jgi:pentatricopeptide repeat protein
MDDPASLRRTFEQLIEGCCRQGRLTGALDVFDDWKAARDAWYVALQQGTTASTRVRRTAAQVPNLSSVTLAFLEACCRGDPTVEWRVFDVVAAMRQQKERKVQAGLARPRKPSHHFAEETAP